MSKFPVLDLWVKDWIHDTKHLRPLERGIYMDMLLLAWNSPRCRLPNDPQKIADRLSYKASELAPLRRIIALFWTVDKLGITISQKRLSKEHLAASKRRALAKVLNKVRWDKEKKALRTPITVTATDSPPKSPLATDGSARKPKRADRPTSKPKEAKPPKPVSLPSMGRAAALPKPIVAGELSADELAAREREAIEFIHSMHKDHE